MDKKNIVFYSLLTVFIFISIITIINQLSLKSFTTKNKYKPKLINFIDKKLNNNSSKLIFIAHLELGDCIVTNGIIRYYCQKYDTVIIPCKKLYINQIKFMYSDVPNLIFYVLPNKEIYKNMSLYLSHDNDMIDLYKKYNIKIITLGCFTLYYYNTVPKFKSDLFPSWIFYELNIEDDIAYNNFKINRNYERENELYYNLINILDKKYIVVIDDEKRNFIIDQKYLTNLKYPIVKIGNNSKNINPELDTVRDPIIFNYIKILENAKEIISIDSSIPWIIDFLNIEVKTTVHTYMRDGNVKFRNKNITIEKGNILDRLPAYFNLATYNSKSCNFIELN
jgi:hypothetical protein